MGQIPALSGLQSSMARPAAKGDCTDIYKAVLRGLGWAGDWTTATSERWQRDTH